MRAVLNRDQKVAKTLINAGALPDAKNSSQDSPFLKASALGLEEVLRSALSHGADVNSVDRLGSTALFLASEEGQVESVRILLQHDVALDKVNDLGWSALHVAIALGQGSNNSLSIVRLLLAAGANPHLSDPSGSNAFDLAEKRNLTQMLSTLRTSSK